MADDSLSKYHEDATMLRQATAGRAVAVAVIAGRLGNGYAVQLSPDAAHGRQLVRLLRLMADQVEQSLSSPGAAHAR